jgi:maltooligosyltrehalose trehalohydrolase
MPRRYPIGSEIGPEGVHFRVWVPRGKRSRWCSKPALEAGAYQLEREPTGLSFRPVSEGRAAGMRYRFRLDGGDSLPIKPKKEFWRQETCDVFSFADAKEVLTFT